MTQPPTRKTPNPTLYLLGFDCYPNDRKYFEARHATGSATPYWFKEKLVYEDIDARPPTRTVVAGTPKSSMDSTQGYDKDSKTIKVEVQETTEDDEASDESILNTKKTRKKKYPAKQASKSPVRKIITIPLPKRRIAFPWTPRNHKRPRASLHRQRRKKPNHAINKWQHKDPRPLVPTPPPYLPLIFDTRLLPDIVPLPQPADRAEHQGNGSSAV